MCSVELWRLGSEWTIAHVQQLLHDASEHLGATLPTQLNIKFRSTAGGVRVCTIDCTSLAAAQQLHLTLEAHSQFPYILVPGEGNSADKTAHYRSPACPATNVIDCSRHADGRRCAYACSINQGRDVRLAEECCPFRHPVADPTSGGEICKQWESGRSCPAGSSCKKRHPADVLVQCILRRLPAAASQVRVPNVAADCFQTASSCSPASSSLPPAAATLSGPAGSQQGMPQAAQPGQHGRPRPPAGTAGDSMAAQPHQAGSPGAMPGTGGGNVVPGTGNTTSSGSGSGSGASGSGASRSGASGGAQGSAVACKFVACLNPACSDWHRNNDVRQGLLDSILLHPLQLPGKPAGNADTKQMCKDVQDKLHQLHRVTGPPQQLRTTLLELVDEYGELEKQCVVQPRTVRNAQTGARVLAEGIVTTLLQQQGLLKPEDSITLDAGIRQLLPGRKQEPNFIASLHVLRLYGNPSAHYGKQANAQALPEHAHDVLLVMGSMAAYAYARMLEQLQ